MNDGHMQNMNRKAIFIPFGLLAAGLMTNACNAKFPISLLHKDASTDAAQQDASTLDSALQDGQTIDANLDASIQDGTVDAAPVDGQTTDAADVDAAGVCGNSTVESGETCDDGNTTSGDGCSSSCQVECSNGSTTDCNPSGETKIPTSAFVDSDPPAGFIQCAGFENTANDDVGPNWDANCFGAVQHLRIRYWDSSANPWTLMGDATLDPTSLATYATQVFDATNHGGTQGVLATQGVTILKDDPTASTVSDWVCNQGHANNEYAASDLYLGNQASDHMLMVCGYSASDDASAHCSDRKELLFTPTVYEHCSHGQGPMDLAVAIYVEK